MSPRNHALHILLSVIVACAVTAAPAGAVDPQLEPLVSIQKAQDTGLATFISARSARGIPVASAKGRTDVRPIDFLNQYGRLFGITDPQKQLMETRVDVDPLGFSHTTYQQVQNGIRVFAGVIKVHQNSLGRVSAANGAFYPAAAKVPTSPTITPEKAQAITARLAIVGQAPVEHLELVIVDPGWYGDQPKGARLAYYIIRRDSAQAIRHGFFVDAHTGALLDDWNMIHTVADRYVYDANYDDWLPGNLIRAEGEDPIGVFDADAAYDFAGDIRDYYFRAHGRFGVDDLDSDIIATIHYDDGLICPNAFWDGYQMVFCDGTVTDDIFAHEFTHGVTQHTADLIYQNQPGQLNESFSDIFGELIDLFNGDVAFAGPAGGTPPWPPHPTGPGQDTPNNLRTNCSMPAGYGDGVRWLMGEDAYSFGGAIRDMWSPECFGDPDRANSQSQRCEYHDNGGVHFGSGVPNHTFAMMVDGKEFNGQTVQGIGPIKAGAVWYRALAYYLTNGSDFRDTYFALNQAAADLIGTDPNDPRTGSPSGSTFTAQDATQVDNACRAAEMDTVGVCGKVVVLDPEPPLPCPGHTVVYSDDFETGATGWTVEHSGPGGDYDWTLTSTPLPHGRTGVAWYCNDLVTDCWLGPDGTALFSLISPEITLPDLFTHPAVAFTHFIQSEQFWDGGNVKIRVNGGQWQLLPPDAFYHNGYPQRPLFDAVAFDNTNPLAGQACFHGPDGTWGTSAAYIGNFVQPGDVIQIRFDFGKDVCTGDRGWYIDDVSVYDCTAANDCNGNTTPDEMEIAAGPQREVFLDRPPLRSGLVISDSNPSQGLSRFVWAPQMTLPRTSEITSITLWGVYVFSGVPSDEPFALRIHAPDGPFPGELVTSATPVVQTTPTGEFIGGAFEEYEVKLTLSPPITLPAGTYFLEIYKQSSGTQAAFAWEISEYLGAPDAALSNTAPGEYWNYEYFSVAILVEGSVRGEDVNGTGVPDECESCVNDADCSDGAYCNGAETCNSNLCWPSDTVPCTDKLCDEVNDRCVECFSDGDCDDGIFCNGKETCDDGSCDAPDESPCEAGELCDEDGDACVECLSDADCDDGDECTVDSCTSDVCSYREIPVCPDLDGDLVVDNQDACPNSPDGADVDARGCACSQLDGDGDGVNNCDDECPSTPRNAQVDALGCAIQTTTPIPPEDEEPIDEPPADDQPGDEQPDGGQGDEPEPEQPLGDVNRGQQRFSDNGCTACHNQQANRFATSGETVIYNTLIGALVHEGGDMPEMADQDLEDMTAYLTAVSRGERFLGPAPAGADSGEPQDPVPSQDDVSDADTGSGNVSRSSGGGSTCGVLGLTNLVFLMAGMALLRSTRRR